MTTNINEKAMTPARRYGRSAPAAPAIRRSVSRFETLETTRIVDGKPVHHYPFLRPENKKDYFLLQKAEECKPWEAVHGEVKNVWEAFTNELVKEAEESNVTSFEGVAYTTIQKRFTSIMKIAKRWASVKETGADGNPLPCEMKKLIMSIFEAYDSEDHTKASSVAAKKAKDREAAAEIRWTALGSSKFLLEKDNTGTSFSDVSVCAASNSDDDSSVIEVGECFTGATTKKIKDEKGLAAPSRLDVYFESAANMRKNKAELQIMREERKLIEAKNRALELQQREEMMHELRYHRREYHRYPQDHDNENVLGQGRYNVGVGDGTNEQNHRCNENNADDENGEMN